MYIDNVKYIRKIISLSGAGNTCFSLDLSHVNIYVLRFLSSWAIDDVGYYCHGCRFGGAE